ncbi:MAG: hypothetical protein ACPGWM_00335 [Flavobacteriales bacterium]
MVSWVNLPMPSNLLGISKRVLTAILKLAIKDEVIKIAVGIKEKTQVDEGDPFA